MAYSQSHQTSERTLRSVFVGNIPYEATEEQLKDIFSEVGPIVSFKLVYDRDTGKPKGYGFCEYKDQETALSAMRNLANIELYGRIMRVDTASNEKNREEFKQIHQPISNMINNDLQPSDPYKNKISEKTNSAKIEKFDQDMPPEKAPEAITKAVASLPPEQMFELMKQMKVCIQNNPTEARNMLLQNPQLAYALLQAQIMMELVDPKVALNMLHKDRNVAQLNINLKTAPASDNFSNAVYSNMIPTPINSNIFNNSSDMLYNSSIQNANPYGAHSMPQTQMGDAMLRQENVGNGMFIPPPPNLPMLSHPPAFNYGGGANGGTSHHQHTSTSFIEPPPFLLSQKMMDTTPSAPNYLPPPSKPDTKFPAPSANLSSAPVKPILPPPFLTMGSTSSATSREQLATTGVHAAPESHASDADLRDLFPGFGGADIDMRNVAKSITSQGLNEKRDVGSSSKADMPRSFKDNSKRPHPELGRLGKSQQPPAKSSHHQSAIKPTGAEKEDQTTKKIKITTGGGKRLSGGVGETGVGGGFQPLQDQDKAALIRQVLQLTNEQIGLLPPDQQKNIVLLKEQILKGAGAVNKIP